MYEPRVLLARRRKKHIVRHQLGRPLCSHVPLVWTGLGIEKRVQRCEMQMGNAEQHESHQPFEPYERWDLRDRRG